MFVTAESFVKAEFFPLFFAHAFDALLADVARTLQTTVLYPFVMDTSQTLHVSFMFFNKLSPHHQKEPHMSCDQEELYMYQYKAPAYIHKSLHWC